MNYNDLEQVYEVSMDNSPYTKYVKIYKDELMDVLPESFDESDLEDVLSDLAVKQFYE